MKNRQRRTLPFHPSHYQAKRPTSSPLQHPSHLPPTPLTNPPALIHRPLYRLHHLLRTLTHIHTQKPELLLHGCEMEGVRVEVDVDEAGEVVAEGVVEGVPAGVDCELDGWGAWRWGNWVVRECVRVGFMVEGAT